MLSYSHPSKYLAHVAFAAAAVGIIVLGWAVYDATARSRTSSRLVAHTLEVILAIDHVNESLAPGLAGLEAQYGITPIPAIEAESPCRVASKREHLARKRGQGLRANVNTPMRIAPAFLQRAPASCAL